jgi:hypothetical protein
MEMGDYFSYKEIEDVTGVKYGMSRFRAVTNRWRNHIRNLYGQIIESDKQGKGGSFFVADDHQKHSLRKLKTKSAVRLVRKSLGISPLIDRKNLTEEEKAEHDHLDFMNGKQISIGQLRQQLEQPEM